MEEKKSVNWGVVIGIVVFISIVISDDGVHLIHYLVSIGNILEILAGGEGNEHKRKCKNERECHS